MALSNYALNLGINPAFTRAIPSQATPQQPPPPMMPPMPPMGGPAPQPQQGGLGGFVQGLGVNPLFLAGLTTLSGFGPGAGAQVARQTQRGRMEQSEFERQQQQRSRMQDAWGRIFPGNQPALDHPLAKGAPPEILALAQTMGPEEGLRLLGNYAMKRPTQLDQEESQANIALKRAQAGYYGAKAASEGAETGPDVPNAIRTEAIRADQAYSNITKALDDYASLVRKTGNTFMPGNDKDAVMRSRRNIQLQLKELFNLGVLNGPDLALMDAMLVDANASANPFSGDFGYGFNISDRVDKAATDIKEMLRGIRNSKTRTIGLPDVAGQQPTGGPQPGTVEDGYRFKGGNPADPNSWEKVQ